MEKITDKEIQDWIDIVFEENYEHLQLDGGHKLSGDIKKTALLQVKAYYKKLKNIAQNVTDVEIKLTLSNQITSQNRRFSIEGVVDLINEGNTINMYDIKTHEADYISAHKELYQEQLNIYRHIWEGINEKKLDNTMIISTALPEDLARAFKNPNNQDGIRKQISSWEPVVNIPTEEADIEKTILEFANVVDSIEGGCFAPPEAQVLNEKIPGTNEIFATRICRNCDVRFSCTSYREYSLLGNKFSEYDIIRFYNHNFIDEERDEFIEENLDLKKL